MAWIESHTVLSRHRKVSEMANQLGIPKPYASGLLHTLWHSALEQQEDGDLSKWSDSFIAESAGWTASPDVFIAALVDSGFMDGRLLHDWVDYAGKYLVGKYHTSDKKRLCEIWRKHHRIYGSQKRNRTGSKQEVKSHSTLPNLTIPNHTLPKDISAPRKLAKLEAVERREYTIPEPTQDPNGALVMYYKATKKKIEYDDRSWDKTHWPRCSKAAKELLAICTSYEAAKACIDQFSNDMDKSERSWTLETVIKWAHDWKTKQGGKDYGATNSARFFAAVSKQRTEAKFDALRKVSTAGEILNGLRDLPHGQPQANDDIRPPRRLNEGTLRDVEEAPLETGTDRGDTARHEMSGDVQVYDAD